MQKEVAGNVWLDEGTSMEVSGQGEISLGDILKEPSLAVSQ
ncbi:unnamed protein product, partial [marine sediment metagenome]